MKINDGQSFHLDIQSARVLKHMLRFSPFHTFTPRVYEGGIYDEFSNGNLSFNKGAIITWMLHYLRIVHDERKIVEIFEKYSLILLFIDSEIDWKKKKRFNLSDIEAECQDDYMKIRIGFNGSFAGLLYSAGKKPQLWINVFLLSEAN